jgi:hypothetical protein
MGPCSIKGYFENNSIYNIEKLIKFCLYIGPTKIVSFLLT